MNPDNQNQAQPPDDLKLDKAEYEGQPGSKTTCTVCKSPMMGSYFSVNQNVVCPPCKESLEQQFQGGSPAGRVLKALAFGVPAAALGFGIYFAIVALTGYEFGLVAIVIGYMVGWAVRKGSGNRGGLTYQLIAVLLTYISISSTYIPYIVQGFQNAEQGQEAASIAPEAAKDVSAIMAPASGENNSSDVQPIVPVVHAGSASATTPENENSVSFSEIIITSGLIFVLALAAPFLSGFENIIGLLIIGFGLFEAWKMNQRAQWDIQGPFAIK